MNSIKKCNRTRNGNFAQPLPTSPRVGFSRPAKVMRQGWGKILDPHHRAGMGLHFLDPPNSILTPPRVSKG